jgi:hypothetical protein
LGKDKMTAPVKTYTGGNCDDPIFLFIFLKKWIIRLA